MSSIYPRDVIELKIILLDRCYVFLDLNQYNINYTTFWKILVKSSGMSSEFLFEPTVTLLIWTGIHLFILLLRTSASGFINLCLFCPRKTSEIRMNDDYISTSLIESWLIILFLWKFATCYFFLHFIDLICRQRNFFNQNNSITYNASTFKVKFLHL